MNIYEKFYKGELPENLQKETENFAAQGESVGEVIFRVGFYIGTHFEEWRNQLIKE